MKTENFSVERRSTQIVSEITINKVSETHNFELFSKIILLLSLLFLALFAQAQNFGDLSFGKENTLDVVTWNIENFPKNGSLTANYVAELIEQLDAEVYALQEIQDTMQLKNAVSQLGNYTCYFKSSYYAGLAYVYKHTEVDVKAAYEIYTSETYWAPFPRSPQVLEFTFKSEDYVVIDNHLKCCGDGILNLNNSWDEEFRRFKACNLLKLYIDENFENDKVMVVGDMNDELTNTTANNVFINIIDDPDNFRFTDMAIAEGSSANWSYPSWPSHLDHIFITNELFEFDNTPSGKTEVIKVDAYMNNGWSNYDYAISDHRPVGFQFDPNGNAVEHLSAASNRLSCAPNPSSSGTTFTVKQASSQQYIKIYTIQGKEIAQLELAANNTSIYWNTQAIPSGVYIAKLLNSKSEGSFIKVVVR